MYWVFGLVNFGECFCGMIFDGNWVQENNNKSKEVQSDVNWIESCIFVFWLN